MTLKKNKNGKKTKHTQLVKLEKNRNKTGERKLTL